jgi:N6-adenosine-specific RNA methylase IME4
MSKDLIRHNSGPPLAAEQIEILVHDWQRQLAIFDDPRDLVDLGDKVEFIRAAAAKAGHARETLNKVGAVLWDVIRRAGQVSAEYERRTGGDANSGVNDVRLKPTAKDLGYHTRQQRQRWETCAVLPDIEVEHLKEKIIASAEGTLTQAALLAAAKHHLREQEAEENAAAMGDGCTVDDLNKLIAAGKKFGVIYADPPWQFTVYSGKGKARSAERKYIADPLTGKSTMTIEELMDLPVPTLAADDCALFMWAVMPELPGAIELMKAWGFTYKTVAFTWVKTSENATRIGLDGDGLHWGMGYWTRANTEVVLFGTRGAPKRLAKDVHQVIISPVGEHSRKPEQTHARVERLLSGPYIELFARRPMKGWTVWGNDITRGLFHQSIEEFEEAAE